MYPTLKNIENTGNIVYNTVTEDHNACVTSGLEPAVTFIEFENIKDSGNITINSKRR